MASSFAKSVGIPYQSERWWYWGPSLGGEPKVEQAVGELLIISGVLRCGLFASLLWERFCTSLVDPGFAPPLGKGVKILGTRTKMDARNRTSAAKQRRGFRRHFCPRHCRFSRLPQIPTFHSKAFATPQRIIVSQSTHAVRSEGGTWQITLIYRYSSQCDFALAAFPSFVCHLGRMEWAITI